MSTLFEPEANLARYRQRIAALMAQYGDKHSIPTSELNTAAEVLRAEHVAGKALRDGDNPSKTLRQHFVSESIVNALGFDATPEVEPRRGSKALSDFVARNVGMTISVTDLATEGDCSEQTVRNFINAHRSGFTNVSRGVYQIIDERQARKESK